MHWTFSSTHLLNHRYPRFVNFHFQLTFTACDPQLRKEGSVKKWPALSANDEPTNPSIT